MSIHFHNFHFLRDEYRPCANPAFEQRVIIRQCVHCPKVDEEETGEYRKVEIPPQEPGDLTPADVHEKMYLLRRR